MTISRLIEEADGTTEADVRGHDELALIPAKIVWAAETAAILRGPDDELRRTGAAARFQGLHPGTK